MKSIILFGQRLITFFCFAGQSHVPLMLKMIGTNLELTEFIFEKKNRYP